MDFEDFLKSLSSGWLRTDTESRMIEDFVEKNSVAMKVAWDHQQEIINDLKEQLNHITEVYVWNGVDSNSAGHIESTHGIDSKSPSEGDIS